MEILTQMGVDGSLAYQFVIIVAVFVIANFSFLGKLQDVLEVREEKTVKLENSADETLEKVTALQGEYKVKVDEANRAALKNATDKKQQITAKYTEQYKSVEREVNSFVDKSRNEFSKEIAGNKDKYLAESESLAQTLVQKILQ
jgi:F0F1-type ATP synthase membrane subunit b/b'